MKIHIPKVEDFGGFSLDNVKPGEKGRLLYRAILTSDDDSFHSYAEKLANNYIQLSYGIDFIHRYLVVVHKDLSADIYINDFDVSMEMRPKKGVTAGQLILRKDVADIIKITFPGIEFKETDAVVYCFKSSWRFGLFFDFSSRHPQLEEGKRRLDIQKMELDIGGVQRYLIFRQVYEVLESEAHFMELLKNGWFPFIELLNSEYNELSDIYASQFDVEHRVSTLLNLFNDDRIKDIADKWWSNPHFASKRVLIEAGISAYLQDTVSGYINCIKNLWTEVEGILRKIYYTETSKGNHVKAPALIKHIIEKAEKRINDTGSLYLPTYFLEYLDKVAFASFNMEAGDVEMSRNSSSHGVASEEQYTKEKALQVILILDQIYFYSL